MPGNMDVMTWFPRREDYEVPPAAAVDESTHEKVDRLNEIIENNQTNIKEIVDGDNVCLEHKIYRTMDLHQDMADLANLLKECEESKEASELHDAIKKAKVGLMNLKAYLGQVDCIEFATAIRNEEQFKVGSQKLFGPWLSWAERRLGKEREKPRDFDHALDCEKEACEFLKEVVKANKSLKQVQVACDGIRGGIQAQEVMASLQEKYYVLCKKAEQRVKNLNHLLNEWKRLEDLLEPTEPKDWDDYVPKQIIIFLRTYASYYA